MAQNGQYRIADKSPIMRATFYFYIACSRFRDSRARGIEKARTTTKKKKKQEETGERGIRVPFTFASSPLSESLEQANFYVNKELKQKRFQAMHFYSMCTFCTFRRWLCLIFRGNRLYKTKDTQQYKFSSVKAYWKGKGLISDWCASLKTSLIKLSNEPQK